MVKIVHNVDIKNLVCLILENTALNKYQFKISVNSAYVKICYDKTANPEEAFDNYFTYHLGTALNKLFNSGYFSNLTVLDDKNKDTFTVVLTYDRYVQVN